MINKKLITAILSILFATGAVVGGYKVVRDNGTDTFNKNSRHTVVSVIDGDTIKIEEDKKVRLLGIDAPEKGGCYYEESKDYLEELLEDEDIDLRKDISDTDQFNRLLRYVVIQIENPEEDNVFVNEVMLRQGYAFTYAISPDTKYRDLFSSAQEEAKKYERGLWGACDYEEEDTAKLREENSVPPNPDCTIKGNISEKGYGKNYFLEGCPNYNTIKIDEKKGEAYFCTEKEAEEAGFTRSESCDNTF